MEAPEIINHTYTFDISHADAQLLNSEVLCQGALRDLIAAAGMTELQSLTHQFSPQGVSVVSLLAESHIALHTWPELKTGYITLTTCKEPNDDFEGLATEIIQKAFTASTVAMRKLQ